MSNDFQEKKASRLQPILETPSFPQAQRQGSWLPFTLPRSLLQLGCFPGLCLYTEALLSCVSCFHKGVILEPKDRESIPETFFSKVKSAIPSAYGHQTWLECRGTANARTSEGTYYRNFQLFLCKVLQCSFRCRFAWKIIIFFFPFPRESSEVNLYATIKERCAVAHPVMILFVGINFSVAQHLQVGLVFLWLCSTQMYPDRWC